MQDEGLRVLGQRSWLIFSGFALPITGRAGIKHFLTENLSGDLHR